MTVPEPSLELLRIRQRLRDSGRRFDEEEQTDSGNGLRRVNQEGIWTCAEIERDCIFVGFPADALRRCCERYARTERCLRCKLFRCVECGRTWASYGPRTVETIDTRGRT